MPTQGLDISPVGLFLSAGLVGKAVMAVLFVLRVSTRTLAGM